MMSDWDDFVTHAKNSHFMFYRDYMDYHSDRYLDHSLIFQNETGRFLAILPANENDGVLISHQGLSFGGLLMSKTLKFEAVLEIFDTIMNYLQNNRLKRFVYKKMPQIYNSIPADEDAYALFLKGARLTNMHLTASIRLKHKLKFQKLRIRQIQKAKSNDLEIKSLDNFTDFWLLLTEVLNERHGKNPVHSIAEITKLRERFPTSIKGYGVFKDDVILAGVIIYETLQVAHAQYISAGAKGKKLGALDLLFAHLITEYSRCKEYFDFGISSSGLQSDPVNNGLLRHKQSFGAHGIVHAIYEM